jgi:hypothetical protein
MVEITCDVCGKVRPDATRGAKEPWILGFDLQAETPTALQRSIRFLDRWDDRRVLELGAIHLCSDKCKEQYVRRSRAA